MNTKFDIKNLKIGIVGLGYVGLPLATGLAQAGYHVVGLDLDSRKVEALSRGESYIQDIRSMVVSDLVQLGRFHPTTDYDSLSDLDVIFICVPTPFDAMKAPDLGYIESAAQGIAKRLKQGQLIVLQSTTFPGTTRSDAVFTLAGVPGRSKI